MGKALLFLLLISTPIWLTADEILGETTSGQNELRHNPNAFLSYNQQRNSNNGTLYPKVRDRHKDIFSKIRNTSHKQRKEKFVAKIISYCREKSNFIRAPNPFLERICKRINYQLIPYSGPPPPRKSTRPMYLPYKHMVYQIPQLGQSERSMPYGRSFSKKLTMPPIMLKLSHLLNQFLKNQKSSTPVLQAKVELKIPPLSVQLNPPMNTTNTS